MDDFLANKIIEDLMLGTMTVEEAWKNLLEAREIISDEKHDEITALITEQLLESESVEDNDELELANIFDEDFDNDASKGISTLDHIDLNWDEPSCDWGSFDFED